MSISLGKQIQDKFHEMSPKHKLLANYLSRHYDKAVFRTAKELAEDVGVSEATVIRFAVNLGYDGYPEMLKALSEMVRSRITTVERLEFSLNSPQGSIIKDVMDRDIANIKRTVEELNLNSFQEAIKSVTSAKRIYIVSLRSAIALGSFLHFYLQILLKNCLLVNRADTLFEDLGNVGRGDLVIGISFARYTRQTVDGVIFAKERGANVLAITDHNTSPLAYHGNIVLLAQRDMATFIDSFVAPLSLINALIVGVAAERPKKTRQSLVDLEEQWESHNVYY